MKIRLLIASPEPESQALMAEMLQSALSLIPLDVTAHRVHNCQALTERLLLGVDDVIMLDWAIAGAGTPELVTQLLQDSPRLRIVTLLPLHLRQYRQAVWNAGACSSVPKEYMDQEWLSSLLCVMRRAMEREAKLLATYATALP